MPELLGWTVAPEGRWTVYICVDSEILSFAGYPLHIGPCTELEPEAPLVPHSSLKSGGRRPETSDGTRGASGSS